MSIEWVRDLSITILGFVASGVLIVIAWLAYRSYREAQSALQQMKASSKVTLETETLVQEGIKVVLPVLAVIQGVRRIFKTRGRQ
jgi:hypothetical protein